MTKTVTIALGVGAAAVVGYFVVSALKPKSNAVPRGTAPQASNTAFVAGIVQGIGGWFSSLSKSSGGSSAANNNAPLTAIGIPDYGSTAYDTSSNYNAGNGDYGPYLPNPADTEGTGG